MSADEVTIDLRVGGIETKEGGLAPSSDPLLYKKNFRLSGGGVQSYAKRQTASSGGGTFSLTGFANSFGDAASFGSIDHLIVYASSTNPGSVTVSPNTTGNAFSDWVNSTSGGVKLKPGYGFALFGDGDGYSLTDTANELRLTTTGGTGSCDVLVFGEKFEGLLDAITAAGAASGLVLCLDAGDDESYDGISQIWRDISDIPLKTNFFRGTTSGSESSDPTFNGVPGGRSASEYFEHDGNDYFSLAAPTAQPAWISMMHRDNAAFSWLAVVQPNSSANGNILGNHGGSTSTIGIGLRLSDGVVLRTHVGNSSSSVQQIGPDGSALTLASWYVLGGTIAESASSTASFYSVNGALSTAGYFSGAYTSPSAAAASAALQIGAAGDGVLPIGTGMKTAALVVWDEAKTLAVHSAVYDRIKGRWNLP